MLSSIVLLPVFVASAFAGLLVEPLPQYTQSQNSATGEYGYSYHGGPSAKTEFGAIDGTKTGSYSYIDGHGITQFVNYIADENGFRVAGTNIPNPGAAAQLLDAPDVALEKAAHLSEHARATHEALSRLHRKKRGLLATAYAAPVAYSSYPAVTYHAAALPLATSHSSRVDIHHSPAVIATSLHPATVLLRKKRGLLAGAYAAPLPVTYTHSIALPTSSSSQSRFQIHNNAKIIEEVHTPVYAAAAPVYAAAAATPVIAKAALPVAAAPVIAKAALPVAAAPVIAKAALPVATAPVYQTLPLSTSSQSRFQVHNGGKIIEEVSQHFYPTAPIAAAALPVAPAFPAQPVISSDDAISVEAA